jgi:hypothetical protein
MSLLDMVVKEYIVLVELLEQDLPIENNRMILDREHFKGLLEKYGYMTFKQKTKVYKDLNFIIHDKNNYTMPCLDHTLNKTVRKVVINYTTFQTIKHLFEATV